MSTYLYEDNLLKDCLCQGDVLCPTEALLAILDEHHAYYAKHPSYKYFMVLTQSCDLVIRGAGIKASYISIAPIRPLRQVIEREAMQFQEAWQAAEKVISTKNWPAMQMLVERIIDKNEGSYFYLHEDLAKGIKEDCCAALHLSIALKPLHYGTLLSAKIAQLQDIFQTKLGWLVGNLYSRVGTPEWDGVHGKNAASQKAAKILKDIFLSLDEEKIRAGYASILEAGKTIDALPHADVFEHVRRAKVKRRVDYFSDRLHDCLKQANETPLIWLRGRVESKIKEYLRSVLPAVSEDADKDKERAGAVTNAGLLLEGVFRELHTEFTARLAKALEQELRGDSIVKAKVFDQ